jgi:transketolase
VEIAVDAHSLLMQQGIRVRVVSMPSVDVFERQPAAFRESVLPATCQMRVAIEAGASQSWYKYVGPSGKIIGLDHFGASAPYEELYRQFGLTAERVAEEASQILRSKK